MNKSPRKHLIRAFVKFAELYHWDDSAKHPRPIRAYDFKSVRQWARFNADAYNMDEVIADICAWSQCSQSDITQEDFDTFVEEELSCW